MGPVQTAGMTGPQGGPSGALPGSQGKGGPGADEMTQLHKMMGQELIAAGKAILSEDARGWGIASSKIRQIMGAAEAMGGQQGAQDQGQMQGPRTGVPTPVSRPVDVHSRRPL